ncbi:hypothetical protein EYC84_008358 [Monilinia fructicola]|uniref:Uncharacterized protein n=1 Tax=Monilinia fructicola TaxID=38448 RepID=A0A5M9JEV6_MONFR|nr:hypothetical protein EYC84_008358 [Monilinia fructicola]
MDTHPRSNPVYHKSSLFCIIALFSDHITTTYSVIGFTLSTSVLTGRCTGEQAPVWVVPLSVNSKIMQVNLTVYLISIVAKYLPMHVVYPRIRPFVIHNSFYP